MNLKLYSLHNDLLELSIKPIRPEIRIAEIFFEESWHPWHAHWELLEVKNFCEDFEIVKNKLIQYYKEEEVSCRLPNGVTHRLPGYATLTTNEEEWRLDKCKIVDCRINEEKKNIELELWFDSVNYKQIKEECEKTTGIHEE